MEVLPYNDTVMDHIRWPRNAGAMENPDGVYQSGDPGCGDTLKLFIRVKDDIITEASFQVMGCGAAIASASAVTVILQGLSLDNALDITDRQVVDYLGGLPPHKIHCSVMAQDAIQGAVNDYRQRLASMYLGQDHTYPTLQGQFQDMLK